MVCPGAQGRNKRERTAFVRRAVSPCRVAADSSAGVAPNTGMQHSEVRVGYRAVGSRAGVALGGEQPQHALAENAVTARNVVVRKRRTVHRDRVGGQRSGDVQSQQAVVRYRTSAAFLQTLLRIEDVEHRADFFGLAARGLDRVRDVDVRIGIVSRGVSVAEVVEEFQAVAFQGAGPGTDYQWKGDCRHDCDENLAC